MIVRIIISTSVAWFVGLVSTSDPLTNIVHSFLAASLCFIPLFILSRFPFLKSATGSVQTLVSVLVCMLALSALAFIIMGFRIASLDEKLDAYRRTPAVESSPNSPDERPQSRADQPSKIAGG